LLNSSSNYSVVLAIVVGHQSDTGLEEIGPLEILAKASKLVEGYGALTSVFVSSTTMLPADDSLSVRSLLGSHNFPVEDWPTTHCIIFSL